MFIMQERNLNVRFQRVIRFRLLKRNLGANCFRFRVSETKERDEFEKATPTAVVGIIKVLKFVASVCFVFDEYLRVLFIKEAYHYMQILD